MNPESKLNELFIDLPEPARDTGNTVGAVVSGKFLFVGGALPFAEGRVQHQGRVGLEVRADNAKAAARMAGVYALALAKRELGSVNRIKQVVRTDGYVACGADFKDHAKIVDGACELFVQIFGPNGKGARSTAGVINLPQNSCVELSVIFEVK